ncbi:fibrobacter succinogenes major paralogous domain-containing protein [Fibrobacter sp.]|uniref:fibrobacter succinogenes major paralogous domain-containing protein n=1 Tax=Fibrobacter sp. TaxID=35828 RepID=UPI0025BB475E|nr:fibrobacter succinogenes major paralogous domain-containing protein [Fibrobacter sp.]
MLLKKIIPCLVGVFLFACGDDDRDFISRPDGGAVESSSSDEVKYSGSSAKSSSSSSSNGLDWSVPKEAYLNPEIDYGTMTDERDGKTYKTVKIGDQIWMAENLNFDAGLGGSGENAYEWSWCYNNVDKNCDVAGRLYTWAAAIDSVKLATDADNPQDCGYGKKCRLASAGSVILIQGVCPSGWHLPSYDEWTTLFTAVGGQSIAANVLKSQRGCFGNGNGSDAFGFSAVPVDTRLPNGVFGDDGNVAYFWSATEDDETYVFDVYAHCLEECTRLYISDKRYAYPIRCVKN